MDTFLLNDFSREGCGGGGLSYGGEEILRCAQDDRGDNQDDRGGEILRCAQDDKREDLLNVRYRAEN